MQHCWQSVRHRSIWCWIQSPAWALKHTVRHVADIGLSILYQLLQNVAQVETVAQRFYQTYYVSGAARSVRRRPQDGRNIVVIRRSPPLFPPEVWNVHEPTIAGNERTNNVCVGWNNAFASVVGHHHPSIWTLCRWTSVDRHRTTRPRTATD